MVDSDVDVESPVVSAASVLSAVVLSVSLFLRGLKRVWMGYGCESINLKYSNFSIHVHCLPQMKLTEAHARRDLHAETYVNMYFS